MLFALLFPPCALSDDSPDRVLVVYNAAFPDEDGDGTGDSEEVALYYAAKRNIPVDHVLPVTCSLEEVYDLMAGWTDFFNELVIPIQNKLLQLGEEQIYYIVTCYGIPLVFRKKGGFQDRTVDNLLDNLWDLGTPTKKNLPYMWWKHPYSEFSPSVPPDLGHFDHSYKFMGKNIYITVRLTGPCADYAKDLVDRALYADEYLHPSPGCYQGIHYLDTQYKAYTDPELQGYPFGYATYSSADKSIAFAKFWAQASGYAWKWENTSGELEIGDPGAVYHDGTSADTAPQALFYAGWYNHTKYNDVWSWIPGSAACDLNSLSILGMREKEPKQFIPNAFLHGLTCGAGVVYEPTLGGHFRPEVFFYHLLNGFNFAESAALSNPGLCFVGMAVGDPLYNPHAEGKVPEMDVHPPPLPELTLSPFQSGQVEVTARIDTFNGPPDVMVAEMEYGPTKAYGFKDPFGSVFRMSHGLFMSGLSSSSFYHFRVRVMDPVGNVSETPDYLVYTRNPDPLIVGLAVDPEKSAPHAPFDLNLHLSSLHGVERLSSVLITLTAPSMGIKDLDVTGLFLKMPFWVESDPAVNTVLIHSTWPGFGKPGDYLFTVKGVHASGASAEDNALLSVR